MNRFTNPVGAVLANNDFAYACDTWHPLPVPPGIKPDLFACGDTGFATDCIHRMSDTHWLVRKPLPPVPAPPSKPKTQKEMDMNAMDDAWRDWEEDCRPNRFTFDMGWHAALRYARTSAIP